MPLQRDWFKSTIDLLVAALGAMLARKKKGEIEAAVAEADGAILKAFGVSGKLALGLTLKDFMMFACRGEEPSPELLQTLSKLFTEWADLLDAAGRTQDAALARARARECLAP